MEEFNEDTHLLMTQEAWAFIDLGEYDEAERIADKLLEDGAEAGYSLKATILGFKEEAEQGIELLKEGVGKFADSWRLKLALANLYGQLENTAVAMAIFDEAAQMPGAETHWIELNRGISYFKGGMIDEALNTFQLIDHPDAINDAFSVQLEILDMLSQHKLIIAMAEEELALLSDPEDSEEGKTLANIYARVASAYWYEDEDNTEAIQHHLRKAIEFDRGNEEALWLIREMKQEYSEDAHIYELLLSGVLVLLDEDDSEVAYPFVCDYVVLAESPQDALEMIKEFEIEQIDRPSLQILEVESEENEEEEPIGIYYVGELAFIGDEEEEDEETED